MTIVNVNLIDIFGRELKNLGSDMLSIVPFRGNFEVDALTNRRLKFLLCEEFSNMENDECRKVAKMVKVDDIVEKVQIIGINLRSKGAMYSKSYLKSVVISTDLVG